MTDALEWWLMIPAHELDDKLPSSRLVRAVVLENMMIGRATGGTLNEPIYRHLRAEFLQAPELTDLRPRFVRTCRSGAELWIHFKRVSPIYDGRRQEIWDSFRDLLAHLEGRQNIPADKDIGGILSSFDSEGVHRAWEKAAARRTKDPEGAITAARTLLETVCKRILEEASVEFGENDPLPKLYHRTAEVLNLAPSLQSEPLFKTILGSVDIVPQRDA